MRRAHSLPVIAIGAAAAGVLVAAARPPMEGPTQEEVDQVVVGVDLALREAAAGVTTRAQTLADLPRLALAVATDPKTVGDLTEDELSFRPRQNETVELGQVPRGGQPVSLLRVPRDSAVTVPLSSPGLHFVVVRGSLRVAAVARIAPRARAEELDGAVAVSWPVDLARVKPSLAAIGGGATLETPGGAIQLGQPAAGHGGTAAVALAGALGPGVRLVLPGPGDARWQPWPLVFALWVSLATLLLTALIWRRASLVGRRGRLGSQADGSPFDLDRLPPPMRSGPGAPTLFQFERLPLRPPPERAATGPRR